MGDTRQKERVWDHSNKVLAGSAGVQDTLLAWGVRWERRVVMLSVHPVVMSSRWLCCFYVPNFQKRFVNSCTMMRPRFCVARKPGVTWFTVCGLAAKFKVKFKLGDRVTRSSDTSKFTSCDVVSSFQVLNDFSAICCPSLCIVLSKLSGCASLE